MEEKGRKGDMKGGEEGEVVQKEKEEVLQINKRRIQNEERSGDRGRGKMKKRYEK